MARKRRRKWMKRFHKWPSLFISLFVILWAVSGVVLNHRETFSSYDLDRRILPEEHHYKYWNNAALKSSLPLDSNRVIFYGNVGIWLYDREEDSWLDMRGNLADGADHHRINAMVRTTDNKLFCGTRFSLYFYDFDRSLWEEIKIPHSENHVVDLAEINDTLWVLTRSRLWKIPLEDDISFISASIPAPREYDNKVGLFKTLWVIHSGELYGLAGILIVDLIALIFVFLTISGLIYFFFPRIMKSRKKKDKTVSGLGRWNRFSIKWHNKIGIWLVTILVITTASGMFLRPPLLIAIASARVGKIPYSVLDDGNPWYDKFRRILYDKENDMLYLATSEGIYSFETGLAQPPEFVYPQPPASVMGYNVFEKHSSGNILVGSFSGLFLWNPDSGIIYDHITGMPNDFEESAGMPLSENMVAGYYVDWNGREYVFDYNRGVSPLKHTGSFPAMPELIRECRMPLWNVALEIHTARLFKPLLGDFYIIFIPLFGSATLTILITGTVLWIRKFRRRKSS